MDITYFSQKRYEIKPCEYSCSTELMHGAIGELENGVVMI